LKQFKNTYNEQTLKLEELIKNKDAIILEQQTEVHSVTEKSNQAKINFNEMDNKYRELDRQNIELKA